MNNLKHENIFLKRKLPAFKRHLALVIILLQTKTTNLVACACAFDFHYQVLGKVVFGVPVGQTGKKQAAYNI